MELVTYRKFNEQDQVDYLTTILTEHKILFEVVEDRDSLDTLYGSNHLTKYFYIKIKQEDFAKADSILLTLTEQELTAVDKDHYLFNFTDEELFDILSKPDEWSEGDYVLAKNILRDRGRKISDDTLKLLKTQRVSELAKPDENPKTWMYAGYIFALLGGLIGLFIGWHLSTYKKTLPDGQRIYGYSVKDRTHGNRILIIGLIMFFISVMLQISTWE